MHLSPNTSVKPLIVERVSLGQLFCSMTLFILGTTWIFVPGADLGRDAWIASIMGLLSGLLLVLLYLRLCALFPGESPVQWLQRLCGRFLGRVICLIYVIYFLYIVGRNVRDVAEILQLSFLTTTPLPVVALVQGMTVGMAAYYGIETSGRVKQIIFPLVMLLFLYTVLAVIPNVNVGRLSPVLEYGVRAVWRHSFPVITTIPYGELVVSLFYIPYVRGRPHKAMLGATVLGGSILVLVTLFGVLVIGAANMAASALPFYDLVRGIQMGGFFQRLDAVIIPMIAFCAYVKSAKFMLASSYGLSGLLGASRPGKLALALGLMVGAWGVIMATSFAEHLEIGLDLVPVALHIPLQIILPFLLWLLAEWRHRFRPLKPAAQQRQHEQTPRWSRIVVLVVAALFWGLALRPNWWADSQLSKRIMKPIGKVIGEPFGRLLGGRLPAKPE